MNNWKAQLADLYKQHSKQQKDTKGTKSQGDTVINYKGRAGYNDAGIPIGAAARKKSELNKKRYAGRKGSYHFSPLKQINDAAAELGKKYRYKNPEHVNIVKEAVEIAKERIENKNKQVTQRRADNELSKRSWSSSNSFAPIPRRNYNYYGSPSDDDGSIEVVPARTERKVEYKNKVWEEVARLRKKYR